MRRRSEALRRAVATKYDVCVIGGGATGAGCALDARLRGLSTLLLDAGDFGGGTSTASTKLIHGGLRYLEQAIRELDFNQFLVLWRALRERRLMMDNAPYLTGQRQFAVPCSGLFDVAYYGIGLKIYEWLSGKASLAGSYYQGRKKSKERLPWLRSDGFSGTVIYSDGQFDDSRYNLALVQSCAELGGEVINYARVQKFDTDDKGKIVAALIQDEESGETFRISARAFLNCTGPFSDEIRHMAAPESKPRLSVSKGVHILLPLPAAFGDEALIIPQTEDGRVIFSIPWQDRLLVGTTETPAALSTDMLVTEGEADYLLRHLNRYLVKPFQRSDITGAFAGLRPLIRADNSRDTSKLIRDYETETLNPSGLISSLGGKWTVYRAMAEDAVDTVKRSLTGAVTPCHTRHHLLAGSSNKPHSLGEWVSTGQISSATAAHLANKFGAHSHEILQIAAEDHSLFDAIVTDAVPIRAEVVYCVRNEMAVRIGDILSRRIGLQTVDFRLALRATLVVAQIMGEELGWSAARVEAEARRHAEQILRLQRQFSRQGEQQAQAGDLSGTRIASH